MGKTNHQGVKRKSLFDWRSVRLGDACSVHPGQHILEAEYNRKQLGIGYLTGPADFGANHPTVTKWTENPKAWCEPGDVLVTVKGAGVGKINLAPAERVAIGRQLMAIRPKTGQITQEFLYQIMTTHFSHLQGVALGATVPGLGREQIESLIIPLPPLPEQKRIAAILNAQLAAVEQARAAAEAQLEAAKKLPAAYLRESFTVGSQQRVALDACLLEVSKGVGPSWKNYLLVGATRSGMAPAKEAIGKNPERYKLVDNGTIFYNPMRILLGSIAMVDEGDETGITSPDYVVFKTKEGVLHPRWFYYWLRSTEGDSFIKKLTRGAVRERMLFRRLAEAEVEIPSWKDQISVAEKMKGINSLSNLLMQQSKIVNQFPSALLRQAFTGAL